MFQASRRHLSQVGESYFEHMRFALTVGFLACGAGLACILHALIPAVCEQSCSRTVGHLQSLFADRNQLPLVIEQSSGVLTFLGLCVLAMCGDTIRLAYLPIYMELQLGTPDWLRGVVISTQSVGMLVFIPIMGILADRFGADRLVVVNVLLGVGANLGFMTAHSEWALIAATVLNAAMWATLGGIGITVAQDLYPSGIGMASSLYYSAIRFAAAIGGIAGGLGVGWFGVPGVFLVPALLCIVSAAGLLVLAIVRRRNADALADIRVDSEEYGSPRR